MPDKEKTRQMPEGDFSLRHLKKPVYAGSLLLSALGILVALVLAFVINDALDKMQASVNTNMDGIAALLDDTGQTVSVMDAELGSLNTTFDDINASVSSLSAGMNGTGATLKQVGASISQVSLIPGLGQYGTELADSGDQIIAGAAKLGQAGGLAGHRENLAQLRASVGAIGADLANQRAKVADAKQSISDAIGLIKLANILVFVMFVTMFAVLMLNSAAGIL
jgi:methyl-accepting chemotaxis protein